MGKTNLFWTMIAQNYTAVSATENPNSKLIKYTCNYCLHRYAYNVTRMAGHLLTDCKKCPQEVKDKINQVHRNSTETVTTNSQSTTRSNVKYVNEPTISTKKLNARWIHVSKHYNKLEPEGRGAKKDKYMCIYCSQRYACNVTRMGQHILDCEMCPTALKDVFYELSTMGMGTSTDSFAFQSCGSDLSEDSNSLLMPTNLFDNAPIENISSSFSETIVHKIELDDSDHVEYDDNVAEKSCLKINNTSTTDEYQTWALFARACYATGTSVNIFQNEHWKKLFKQISPNVKLPSSQLLSQDYLNDEYTSIRDKVEEKIKQGKTLGLQIHGLHDKKYQSAVIIIFTTPEPVVYKIEDAKTTRRNPNNLTDIISKIINDNGINRTLSVVTDNEQISWKGLESKIPNSPVSCYTCNLHILKLLISDILNLNTFRNVISTCKAIVNEIKNCPNIIPMFFDTGDEDTDLSIPSKKHWEKTKVCINNLIKNKNLLRSVAESTEYLNNNKNYILDETKFWPNVTLLQILLEYLDEWVKQMKAETPCISSVVQSYFDLNNKFKETFTNLHVNEEQSTEILKCLTNCQNLAIQDIHKAASLLNPYYMGKNLSDEDMIDAIAFINKLAKILPEVKSEKIMFDIAAYRTKQGIWAKDFVWESLTSNGEQLPPVIWWESMCTSTEISKIAVAVLSCSPTLINIGKLSDSDGHKRCKSEKAQKLVYIRHNLKLLEEKKENQMETDDSFSYSTDSDSDTDSENDY